MLPESKSKVKSTKTGDFMLSKQISNVKSTKSGVFVLLAVLFIIHTFADSYAQIMIM